MGNGMINTEILYSLTEQDNIFKFLDNFCSKIHEAIEIEHPNSGQKIQYTFNNGVLCFYSNFIQQLQFSFIVVGNETLKICNLTEDPNNPGF
jgi:hypothetical protein